MPNKTIYVRNEDLELLELAETLSGKSISPLIVELLRKYVDEQEVQPTPKKRLKRTAISLRSAADELDSLAKEE